jgi:SAM-dependent methyltransferase
LAVLNYKEAMMNEWIKPEHAEGYLVRMNEIPHRAVGGATLLSEVPTQTKWVLDAGCGDGHLLSIVLAHCPLASGVGLDLSPTMLEHARRRFVDTERVTLLQHNLDFPLPEIGAFDCVVSSFAIHHCTHQRKRELYAELFSLLTPGGVFCNLEHVASPTQRIHTRFLKEMSIDPGDEDPSNKLLNVETQLRWMQEIGFEDVDCHWKWRELALLAGRKPEHGS